MFILTGPWTSAIAAVAAGTMLLTPLVAYAQQRPVPAQQRQAPRATTTPVAVKVFAPGPYRYTPKSLPVMRKTLPPLKPSQELLTARKELFPTGPTAIHAKLTPAVPLVAGKAGMNIFDSGWVTTTPDWGSPQAFVHADGGVSVDLRAMADKTYLFNAEVQSDGGGDCRFRIEGPDTQVVEIPCKSGGPQNLLFAFKTGPTVTGDMHYFFAIRSYKDFSLYAIQIDTQ